MRTDLKAHFNNMPSTSRIKDEDLIINIHHVGGIGGYGPTSVLSKLKDVRWIIYDADAKALSHSAHLKDKNYLFINKCIGKINGKAKFYITKALSASSMFKTSPSAANYTVINSDGTAQIWGPHTKAVRTFTAEVTTLDTLVKKSEVPQIDFISSDTQGAELDILEGASNGLKNTTIGMALETDFSELYSGQPLFSDIQTRLLKDNFRLCQIFNHQFFNSAPFPKELQGKGFHTVAESLFLKDFGVLNQQKNIAQLLKLAAVALVFDQLDYALAILKELRKNKSFSLSDLAEKTSVGYVKLLAELYEAAIEIEKSAGPLKYQSTNSDDKKSTNTQADSGKQLNLFLHYLGTKISGNYYSKISQIYAKFDLTDLAKLHDERNLDYVLFQKPGPLNRPLMTLLHFKRIFLYPHKGRNYFKGTHRV